MPAELYTLVSSCTDDVSHHVQSSQSGPVCQRLAYCQQLPWCVASCHTVANFLFYYVVGHLRSNGPGDEGI